LAGLDILGDGLSDWLFERRRLLMGEFGEAAVVGLMAFAIVMVGVWATR
jgi:hypothetical protein